jgi:hypothetical protein
MVGGEIIMQFMLSLFTPEEKFENLPEDRAKARFGAYMAYRTALVEAGAFVEGARLRPVADATTVRVSGDGKSQVLDGPYAETKEQLAGYFLIDAPDLDTAIAWAARCPAASEGVVEVRPVWPVPVTA